MRHLLKGVALCLPLVFMGCKHRPEPHPHNNGGGGSTQTGPEILAIEGVKLLQFNAAKPGTIQAEKTITGYTVDNASSPPSIVGMDFRLSNGVLYVLFSD